MIKILQCVSNMDRAGIETMLMNYYRNIDRNSMQFYFLCNKRKKGAYNDEIMKLGGKIFYSPGLNPLKAWKYNKEVIKIIKENNIDIIHVHNGAFGLQALIAAKKCGVQVRISHAHGTRIDYNIKMLLKLIYKSKLKKYANYYWGCGEQAIKYYFGTNIPTKKKYLLTNAIDIDKFRFSEINRIKIRNSLQLDNKTKIIGHIGRFMTQKNHKFVIDVFEKIFEKDKDYKLLLIGDGELFDECKKIVEQKKLLNSVIFTGNIPNTNEYYSAMDAFFLPSLFEGLPVVGIEAQTNGLNCLLSDTISDEVNITGNVFFMNLKNNDPCEWADKLIELSKERNHITNEISISNYSIKQEAIKLQKKYTELLKMGDK